MRQRMRQASVQLYAVPTFRFSTQKCPRCGGQHEDLPTWALDPNGRPRPRGGETHRAVCPVTGWWIFWVTEWRPTGAREHEFRMVTLACQ